MMRKRSDRTQTSVRVMRRLFSMREGNFFFVNELDSCITRRSFILQFSSNILQNREKMHVTFKRQSNSPLFQLSFIDYNRLRAETTLCIASVPIDSKITQNFVIRLRKCFTEMIFVNLSSKTYRFCPFTSPTFVMLTASVFKK